MKSQQSVIEYRVIEANKYPGVKKYGYKQISQIKQKTYDFQFLNKDLRFELELQFRRPAIVSQIQLKMKHVDCIQIDMYSKDKLCCNFTQLFDHKSANVYRAKIINLQEKSGIFTKAVVKLLNIDVPKATCINYLLFKGHIDKKQQDVTIANAFESFQRKNKKESEERKVVEQRNKQKQIIRKAEIKDLIKQVQTERYRGVATNQKIEEETQLEKAIQQSRKQHELQLKKKEQLKLLERQNKHQNKQEENFQQQFFDYEVVDWDKVKKYYEHVTPEWIEAQRAAEKQRSVQARHSVAEKVKPKLFKGRDFCINNIMGKEKTELVRIIKEMGGNLIEEPKDRCLVITNKMEGGKISMAKQMQGVKFVRPDYVHECYKTQSALQEKDYKV